MLFGEQKPDLDYCEVSEVYSKVFTLPRFLVGATEASVTDFQNLYELEILIDLAMTLSKGHTLTLNICKLLIDT